MTDVVLERTYAQDVATVWTALTDRRALSSWFMETEDFTPEVGAPLTFRAESVLGLGGVVTGGVTVVDPRRRLQFTWRGGGIDTVAAFELSPIDRDGTRLRVVHTGFDGLRGAIMSRVLGRGWRRLLDTRLPAAVLLLTYTDPSQLDFETVAAMAGDREDGMDIGGLLRRWTET